MRSVRLGQRTIALVLYLGRRHVEERAHLNPPLLSIFLVDGATINIPPQMPSETPMCARTAEGSSAFAATLKLIRPTSVPNWKPTPKPG